LKINKIKFNECSEQKISANRLIACCRVLTRLIAVDKIGRGPYIFKWREQGIGNSAVVKNRHQFKGAIMSDRTFRFLFYIPILSLCLFSFSLAANRYVSASATGAMDGTFAHPFSTIQAASDVTNPATLFSS